MVTGLYSQDQDSRYNMCVIYGYSVMIIVTARMIMLILMVIRTKWMVLIVGTIRGCQEKWVAEWDTRLWRGHARGETISEHVLEPTRQAAATRESRDSVGKVLPFLKIYIQWVYNLLPLPRQCDRCWAGCWDFPQHSHPFTPLSEGEG